MKIALLFSLLIYQLLQHCSATDYCRPLPQLKAASIRDWRATVREHPGSNIPLLSPTNTCNGSSNNTFVLAHLNHHTGKLDNIRQQNNSKFTITDLQLSTSGIYCMFEQCATRRERERSRCCIRIISIPEVEIILPSEVENNAIRANGVCYAKTWPLLTANDMNVFTNDSESCTITKFPLRPTNEMYKTAMFFKVTVNNLNSPCLITCSITTFGPRSQKHNVIRIDPTTTMSTTTPTDITTTSTGSTLTPSTSSTGVTVGPTSNVTTSSGCTSSISGALGLYRITLWIIVLTLTILSTAITSLTPGIL